MNRTRWHKWLTAVGMASLALGAGLTLAPRQAAACGCFAPPDPSVPVLQAGERILFALDGNQVTAHIQIQYAGNAAEFGWLLPLPAQPVLELGTDELFASLTTQTQPKYRLNRVFKGNCNQSAGGFGFGGGRGGAAPEASNDGKSGEMGPLVFQSSIGPYDYAVLKADSKQEMFDWLKNNRYFVPVGTEDAVGPYIHKGAFFLALKLKSGAQAGDLQPVVVRYSSDLPMIPIVLTSVAAQKDMGIQVWMLGQGRAIPRNYYHTLINDAAIDWLTAGQNYNQVIIKAVDEAPGHHSFVTEYAGTSAVMKNVLNAPGRFGTVAELKLLQDPVAFTQYLLSHRFPLTSQVTSLLGRYIPYPPALQQRGINPAQFYQNLNYYIGPFRQQNPQLFAGLAYGPIDAPKAADELQQRIVVPTLAAGKLFDQHAYLTRLYTTLSPDEMNRDPVFSYNKSLPDVANLHEATMTIECGFLPGSAADAWIRTADGFTFHVGDPNGKYTLPQMPQSRRIEILRETGAPELLADNTQSIAHSLGGAGGCSTGGRASSSSLPALLGLGAAALLLRRRRRE